ALCTPRSIHGAHELRGGPLDRQRELKATLHEDLTDQRDGSKVGASEDDSFAQGMGAGEVLPSLHAHRLEEPPMVEPSDVEDLEVLDDRVDEHAARAGRV